MAIVKIKNQSGVTYAYESISHYDPETKKSRPIKRYLGRIDPVTGEIIKTDGKKGRPRKVRDDSQDLQPDLDFKSMYENCQKELEKTKGRLVAAERDNERLLKENRRLAKSIADIKGILSNI